MLLVGLRKILMDIYFLALQYRDCKTHQIFCVPVVKNQMSLIHIMYSILFILYSMASCPKTSPDFISELIHLNYSFDILIKISLKNIKMEASSQFHDGAQLKKFTHTFRSVSQASFILP